jgi:AcrR family transcriptional regulator
MTAALTPAPKRTAGRPRSVETDRAILDAALALLVEQGFGGLSMEGVAARAGVGKAAIYRRWSSKAELVVDALRGHACSAVPLVDTGDLRADLLVMFSALQRAMAGEDGSVMTALVAEKARHPELRAEFDRVFVQDRRLHLQKLLRDAIDRGELPADTDVELLAEAGPAMMSNRLFMHGHAPDPKLPARIVELLLGPRQETP